MRGVASVCLTAVIISSAIISSDLSASQKRNVVFDDDKIFPVSFDGEVKKKISTPGDPIKNNNLPANESDGAIKAGSLLRETGGMKDVPAWQREQAVAPSVSDAVQKWDAQMTQSARVSISKVDAAPAEEAAFTDALRQAVRWHPLIKRAQQELALSEESVKEAQAAWYPTLDVGIKSGFEENSYSNENERTSKAILTASQMLYDFGKTGSRVGLAKSNASLSAADLHKNINEILYETATAWLQVDRLKKLIVVAGQQVEGFRTINEIARKRRALGASAQSEYSQSKVRLATVIALLHDYSAQYKKWVATLSSLVNKSVTTNNSDLSVLSGQECYRINTKRIDSPAIKMAENKMDIAKEQIGAMQSVQYPTISLSPTYEYRIYDDRESYHKVARKGEFGVFLNITAPVFQGGAQQSRVRQAQQSFSAAKYNLDAEKKEAERRIVEAKSQIENTTYSIEAKKVREQEAIRTRDLYKLQYIELGTRSFSDLLSAEAEIHQTRMDIINGNFTIASFALDCLYLSGELESRFIKNREENKRGKGE